MKTSNSTKIITPCVLYKWMQIICFTISLFSVNYVSANDVKVMAVGLGTGTITSSDGLINCGADCDDTYGSPTTITLTATALAGSTFVRWEGDVTGSTNPIAITTTAADQSIRAVFELTTTIPEITNFTPEGIRNFLVLNPIITTPAHFLAALPDEYKENWILMSRSESLQTGTAKYPRILLPSENAQFVFSIGTATHSSYPGSHPQAIEYMQWDATQKNFRFHEIVLNPIPQLDPDGDGVGVIPPRPRTVFIDDSKCSKCHSTRNVLNESLFPGTTGFPIGLVPTKNKPNWDTYDSWGGMLPFNRDRIYKGSAEAAAFREIFNLWTWRNEPEVRAVIEQLELQPPGVPAIHNITRTVGGTNDGHINFAFDASPPVLIEPAPTGTGSISTNYSFDGTTGSGTPTTVQTGGDFVTLHHSADPTNDEGRGVQLFDLLGGADGSLNQMRIADELINHRFATGSHAIDIRPIVLAITRDLVVINSGANTVESNSSLSLPALTVPLSFFNDRNGMMINSLVTDTRTRAQTIPRRKADIQKLNLDRTGDIYLDTGSPGDGLVQEYGGTTSSGLSVAESRIRQEVFRRPTGGFNPDASVMGGIYVDREQYGYNTDRIALFRYFLEPLGVSVDKWSLAVRGRSRSYAMADVFSSYILTIRSQLETSLTSDPIPGLTDPTSITQIINAVNTTLSSLPASNEVPKYTDVQRIFNKACIECHGGLDYPPYQNYGSILDLSEDESPPAGDERLDRAYNRATLFAANLSSPLYSRINMTTEDCPGGIMPCGGPGLSKTDIETIRRWIVGANPYTHGDPHIKTVDGTSYDFQADGEFVLLKGQNMEIQTRQKAIETNGPLGPNRHTGLTSCVSINTAVAIEIGKHRITYQPISDGNLEREELRLRVNGDLVELTEKGIELVPNARIMPTSAQGGFQVEAPGGTVIIVTPGFWSHYQVWYLNIDARQVRATEGLMGIIPTGSWLPLLPDGTVMGPRPTGLGQRFEDLYYVFGEAWRVKDSNSLFDYAPGTSTETFTNREWPILDSQDCIVPENEGNNKPTQELIPRETATKLCFDIADDDRRENCIMDVMITGEVGFAETYLASYEITKNKYPDPPKLIFPEDFNEPLDLPITFHWDKTIDQDGDDLTYRILVWQVDEEMDDNKAITITGQSGKFGGGKKCATWVFLIGLLLLVILYFLGLKRNIKLLLWLALAVIVVTILAYFYCGKVGGSTSHRVSQLDSGESYFWKVIAEDGRGGKTESETWRFDVK